MCRAGRVDVSRTGKSRQALHSYGSIQKTNCETKFARTILILNKPVFGINFQEKIRMPYRFLLSADIENLMKMRNMRVRVS